MENLCLTALRAQWQATFGWTPPSSLRRSFMEKNLHYQQQVQQQGGLSKTTLRQLRELAVKFASNPAYVPVSAHTLYKPGTRLIRIHKGRPHEVTITEAGFAYNDATYASLSAIARHITGTPWNGHTFFGIKRS